MAKTRRKPRAKPAGPAGPAGTSGPSGHPPKATRSNPKPKNLAPMVDDLEKHLRLERRAALAAIFPFTRLPAELRIRIYEFAIGFRNAEVVLKPWNWDHTAYPTVQSCIDDVKLTHTVLTCRDDLCQSPRKGKGKKRKGKDNNKRDRLPPTPIGEEVRIYPLPPFCRICGKCKPVEGPRLNVAAFRICKTIYHEARRELYGNITVVVASPTILSAFLKRIGHLNAALIRRMRVYHSNIVCSHYSPINYWVNAPWKQNDALSSVTMLSNLKYLQVINVVGAGNPYWRTSYANFNAMHSIKRGWWTGGYVQLLEDEDKSDRRKELKKVFEPGPRRFWSLRQLTGLAEMDVSVNDDWLMDEDGGNRRYVIETFGLDGKMKEAHIRAVRTGKPTEFK